MAVVVDDVLDHALVVGGDDEVDAVGVDGLVTIDVGDADDGAFGHGWAHGASDDGKEEFGAAELWQVECAVGCLAEDVGVLCDVASGDGDVGVVWAEVASSVGGDGVGEGVNRRRR